MDVQARVSGIGYVLRRVWTPLGWDWLCCNVGFEVRGEKGLTITSRVWDTGCNNIRSMGYGNICFVFDL